MKTLLLLLAMSSVGCSTVGTLISTEESAWINTENFAYGGRRIMFCSVKGQIPVCEEPRFYFVNGTNKEKF